MTTSECVQIVIGIAGLTLGILGIAYAVWSDQKRKQSEQKRAQEREWVHMGLANLKPSIQQPDKEELLARLTT